MFAYSEKIEEEEKHRVVTILSALFPGDKEEWEGMENMINWE